jgi:hypothetical protein
MQIFEEYLKTEARYYVRLEPNIRIELYKKFGQILPIMELGEMISESGTSKINDSVVANVEFAVDQDVLFRNLNQGLFYDVYVIALESLDNAFDQFKKSLSFAILREDIKRQEKLFQVMIEGGFVMNT